MPVGLGGASEQNVQEDPKSVFASQRISRPRPSAGLDLELSFK